MSRNRRRRSSAVSRRPGAGLSRRAFLRGIRNGAAVSIALPFFEASMNATGTAFAQNGAFPRRFGMFFWGNGVLPDKWIPTETGANYTLSEQLEPLASIKDVMTVVTGTEVRVPNLEPHFSGAAGFLSGQALVYKDDGSQTFGGPSIDQIIAQEIGGDTTFRSIEFGAKADGGLSYNGPDNKNPPETNPFRLFERIFGPEFREPGDSGEPDPRLALRRSVLDSVMDDMSDFRRDLGTRDQQRLEQHLTSVRELEIRLARLAEDPVTLAACTRAGEPLPEYPDIDGRPQLGAANRAMCDIMALALACDQTRVFSNFITKPINNLLLGQANAGHHQLTHDEPGDQPQVNAIVKLLMEEYRYLVEAMRAIPEGDGTLLDNCMVLGTSEISYGRTHAIDEFPILISGTAGGRLVQGTHVRAATPQNANSVVLSMMRALDITRAGHGVEESYTEDSFSEIEA